MTADASVRLIWAGEERKFRLAIRELRELQETVNRRRGAHAIGPLSLWKLVAAGDAWPDDIREVIRLGLVGGGETPSELIPGLVKRYVDELPLLQSVPVAAAILGAALQGVDDDPLGKKSDGTAPGMATTSLDFPSSTDQAPQSDSHRARSTNAAFGNSQHVSRDGTERTAPGTSPTQ